MNTLIAHRVGELGFTAFARALYRLGVLDREEWLGLVAFHGSVIRWSEPPLDRGHGCDDELRALGDELGGHLE